MEQATKPVGYYVRTITENDNTKISKYQYKSRA